MRTTLRLFIALSLLSAIPSFAQKKEALDTAAISKIKDEGLNRSQVMNTLSMLTDIYGPRLTNSPGFKKAATYARSTLESWGLQNVQFDQWGEDFGTGWELKKFSLVCREPVYFPVICFPKAWSPGIKGPLQADVVFLDIKTESDLAPYTGKLKGKIILFTAMVAVNPGFKPDASRLSDSSLLVMSNAGSPTTPARSGNNNNNDAQRLTFHKWEFCAREGALAVLEASPAARLEDGTVAVQGITVPYLPEVPQDKRLRGYSPGVPKLLPQIMVADEHYNRLVRQVQKGMAVKIEVTLDVEFTPVEKGFNVIAEIPGSDLKDEVVMIGAHLDSWHGGTGATDNGAGSAVMMEAMRILKTLGTSPRRTIRIGLWGGEEQGLLGSKSYVKRNYGERLDKARPYDSIRLTPAAEKFSVYFNMDNGTGKYRGVYLQGNDGARSLFREWLKPFEKMGAATLTLDNTTGTDHLSYDAIGLPAFQFIQDPIEYSTRTHHTTMDLYDKAIEADLKHNAVITASLAWSAANRQGLVPRK